MAAVVGAVGSALTLRRRRAHRHEEALHAAAHLAAPILTAHHYASR